MKKTGILFMSLLLIVCVTLTACGGGESAAGGKGKKTINLALWDENAKEFVDKSIALYKETHPDVEVKVTYTPFADYWTKLKTSLAGKGGPDVFWMNGPNFYSYASSGLLKDLQPLIEQSKMDVSVYNELLRNMYTYEGKLYGIPYFQDVVGLYYNKELFDKAGIAYPDHTWTWDTLEQNARKLTDKENGVYGFIAPVIDSQPGYYNFIAQAGGYVISEDKTKSGFDSPEALAAFEWMDSLIKAGISPTAQQQLETEPKQMFASGRAAMFPAISVSVPELHGILGDKLGVAELPAGKRKASIVHGLSWSINKSTEHEQEAWELIQALAGEEGSKYLAESGFSIPAYKGAEEGWLKSVPGLDLTVFTDSLEFGVQYPISEKTAEWQAVETKELQNAFLGKQSIPDALHKIAAEMNAILETER